MPSRARGECISIHVGQAGCQIGSETWRLLCQEHGILPDGTRNAERASEAEIGLAPDTCFSESFAGLHQPRAIFVDTDPTTRSELLSQHPQLFLPQSLLGYKQDCKNNFFCGREAATEGKVTEDVLDQVRLALDRCSYPQGFIVTQAFGGGTGAGIGTHLLQSLRDAFDKKVIFHPVVYPSMFPSSMVEPYNCVLASYFLGESADVSLILDNQAIYDICETKEDVSSLDLKNVNNLIAQCISMCTAPVRFPSQLHLSMAEMAVHLAPTPKLRYQVASLAPIRHPHACAVAETVRELLHPKSLLCSLTHLQTNRYVSAVFLLRGKGAKRTEHDRGTQPEEKIVKAEDVAQSLQRLVEQGPSSPLKFALGVSPGYKADVVGVPMCRAADDALAQSPIFGMMMGNTTAVRELLVQQFQKFLQLFFRRAYVWKFLEANGDMDVFCEAKDAMEAQINHYEELLLGFVEEENKQLEMPRLVLEGATRQ